MPPTEGGAVTHGHDAGIMFKIASPVVRISHASLFCDRQLQHRQLISLQQVPKRFDGSEYCPFAIHTPQQIDDLLDKGKRAARLVASEMAYFDHLIAPHSLAEPSPQ